MRIKAEEELKKLYNQTSTLVKKFTYTDYFFMAALPVFVWPLYFKYKDRVKIFVSETRNKISAFRTKSKSKGLL
jgi:hypothetical protein